MVEQRRLKNPPIDEVVCGFVFAPLPVDTMDFGVYWESRKKDFPTRQIHPAILDGELFLAAAPPMRSWLISGDDSRVIQLQNDRFFMNWRRREGDYPRFSNSPTGTGLRTQAIAEFDLFSQWLADRTQQELRLSRHELSKIDLLKKGVQYETTEQLGELMPVAKVFSDIQISDPKLLHLRLVEANEETTTNVQVTVSADAVRIETRHLFPAQDDVTKAFDAANERVNQVFFGLFKTGLHAFGG